MTWIARNGADDGAAATKRVMSTPRTRYGPVWATAIPAWASGFAMRSVVSRGPRPDRKGSASERVPGGSVIGAEGSAVAEAHGAIASNTQMHRAAKQRSIPHGGYCMRTAMMLLGLALMIGAPACKKNEPTAGTGSATGSGAGSGSGSGSGS